MARYGIVTSTRDSEIESYSVVDVTIFPDDTKKFMADSVDWYRKKVLASFKLATFPVTMRQAEVEAHKRAVDYADYMNRQQDAIDIATKLVTI